MNKDKIAVVPRVLINKDVKVVPLKHPKTGKESNFVIDENQLFQVVKISQKNPHKSIFIESNEISVHGPNLEVLLPVNPLFILLPTIFASTTLPLELVLNIASGDWCELPEEMARKALGRVCTLDDDMVTLDKSKLSEYLKELVLRVPVPKSFEIIELDLNYKEIYQNFVGVNFISSWLPETLDQYLRSLYDFNGLETHVTEIIKKKEEANTIFQLNQRPQEPKKRPLKGKESANKKKAPANNRSILDMFKKK